MLKISVDKALLKNCILPLPPMIFKIILWGILFYFIYRFVFGVVVPVSKATSQMKDKIREMQDLQQQQFNTQRAQEPHTSPLTGENQQKQGNFNSNAIEGDYIDFEEVK